MESFTLMLSPTSRDFKQSVFDLFILIEYATYTSANV